MPLSRARESLLVASLPLGIAVYSAIEKAEQIDIPTRFTSKSGHYSSIGACNEVA